MEQETQERKEERETDCKNEMRDKTGKEKGEVINNVSEIDIKKCIYDYFLKRYKRNINVSYIKMILFFFIHFFQQGTATNPSLKLDTRLLRMPC